MKHTNDNLGEGIARPELHVDFAVDCSGSMEGEKIGAVNNMMRDMANCLKDVQEGTSDATIKLSALIFSDRAEWLYDEPQALEKFKWKDIVADGETNFSDVADKLALALEKKKNKGFMPDRGGLAPIILILSDGESTARDWRQHLAQLQKKAWYKVALVYFCFIGEKTPSARELAEAFAGPERVFFCSTAEEVVKKVKVIAVTASQVKSQSGSASGNGAVVDDNQAAQDAVAKALSEEDDDEW
ncbi:MAG: VWA domain-containing protein [Clostridia bacterium]|nr:VWA domain-containing protein [Clostridia bacterium]